MSLKFGLHLPSAQPGASVEGLRAVLAAAEESGFDSAWMFDHLFTPEGLRSSYPYSRDGSYALSPDDPFFDPLGLLGVLAGSSDRIRLGTAVLIAAYRHPIVLAKILATIENFAPRRLILGLGAGWMKEEFAALDIPFKKRGARLDEYVAALRHIWSGDRAEFEGTFYSWPSGGFEPLPSEPIPLIIGGHSDRAVRRAARLGDGWAIATGRGQGRGLEAMQRRLEVLDAFLQEAGRDRTGFELLHQDLLWFSDEPNPKLPFTGRPEDMAANLKRYAEAGVTTVDLVVFGPPALVVESAQRFAEEVRPLL